jgi:(1->4)-alpha-D-glucan 1-alpha-D-glucosylmutase
VNTSVLDLLCRHYGIAPDYTDIRGRHHVVPVETRRALLRAMGVDAGSEAALHEALAAAEASGWRRLLPPVKVVRTGAGTLDIDLRLPAALVDSRWRWTLTQEGGQQRGDEFLPAALALQEQRNLQGAPWRRLTLRLADPPGPGYHHLRVQGPELEAGMALIVAPRTCYQPESVMDEGRVWGLDMRLYALRSQRNWGIGDFTDLTRVLEFAAREGAGVVGLNPVHALDPRRAGQADPYSPSSRLFLNTLYLDVESIPDFRECTEAQQSVADPDFQARLRALRAEDLVDYEQVAANKRDLLERLYGHFRAQHLADDSDRGRAFRRYQSERGDPLHRHALYEALQEHFLQQDADMWGWPAWPRPYRDPDSDAVATFAGEQRVRIEFFEYLQWQAELQLDAAGRRAFELGLGIGISLDLAVSADIGGSEAWTNQTLLARQARVGSPPDDLNLQGQALELLPWIPERLRAAAYGPFIAALRRNMRAAGALRIDHVTGLRRLFWIPREADPADGGYVYYPLEDLLGILALESRRNRCMVIGAGPGTVPDVVRRALDPLGVLSCRLLYFAKNPGGAFTAPQDYSSRAQVAVSAHELPTLAGFWSGNDLEWRRRLDLFPSQEAYARQVVGRAEDRARLLLALVHEGLLPAGTEANPAAIPEMTPELARAIHLYLAQTPARVFVVQPEDMLGQTEPASLPGSAGAHPDWRRKLALEIESWADEARIRELLAALRGIRGTAVQPPLLPSSGHPLPARAQIPRATYRLQFTRDFTFDTATTIVPYLEALGISHCYASPLIKARPGSSHGYDIVDHNALNPELGDQAGLERFSDALQARGMGLILDVVPNHMGVMGRDNPWWLEVLENGRASRYAAFFDIDWNPLKEELRGKVLLPVLGDHYGNVLDRGELRLVFNAAGGDFVTEYYEHSFPIDPREYPRIFRSRQSRLAERLGKEHPRVLEFASLMTAFHNLPPRDNTTQQAIDERARDKEMHKRRLAELYAADADIAWFVDEALREFNGAEGYPPDPAMFHELLQAQAWRLAFWRVAADQINYRRFFDINELAALRMENRRVFDATHRLLFALIAAGRLQGLRVDHPDGLFDPSGYFQRLQESVTRLVAAGGTETGVENKPLYIVAEKILAAGEQLPPDWQVHGTTGYDFARECGGLYVEADAVAAMQRTYTDFVHRRKSFAETARRAKMLIMQEALASELTVLATELARIAELDIHTRDFTSTSLRRALEAVVADFPVYRSYVTGQGPSAIDEVHITHAVDAAQRHARAADATIFGFVRDVLLTRQAEGKDAAYRERVLHFAMKFQQYTSPVTAKGVEDTAFYRYYRLVSLNEVGGEPEQFGTSIADFHLAGTRRRNDWPHSMLCTSTHDAKRSEDVRARIHALSELPGEWRRHVNRWAGINRVHRQNPNGRPAPSADDEYLLYQTLIGTWPPGPPDKDGFAGYADRIRSYMLKAAREAKLDTSWLNPDPAYETALREFTGALLDPATSARFIDDFMPFQRRIARIGMFNSLSQTALKLTAPGVPDIYQGNELWELSLVDPDNRRAVDFGKRRILLEGLQQEFAGDTPGGVAPEDLLNGMSDGRIKLFLTWKCLALRRRFPELFENGDYLPLQVTGPGMKHLCAFARHRPDAATITVAPRLIARFVDAGDATPAAADLWQDTRIVVPDMLARRAYTNVFTGEAVSVEPSAARHQLPASRLLARFPVAVLGSG